MMGYTNVALAVLDVGAETKVAQRLGPVAMDLAKSGVQVSRQKWSQVMGWVKQGPAGIEQTRAWLASVKGMTREMADRAMDAISPVEVAGVGRVSRAEVRGTAEGTTEQAVQKARAGAGGTVAAKPVQFTDGISDAAAEQLLAKYPQWNEVKEFVGKHLDPNNLPPGYKYRVKNGQPELYRDSTEGPFPPLTVKKGIVELQTGQSSRLSVFSRYKKNYLEWVEETQGKAARTAAEQRLADGNQLHHLVPDAVVRDNLLTRQLMKRSKTYTLDRGPNILDMPVVHDPKTGKIVHLGSHEKFNEYVDGLLNLEIENLTGGRTIPLEKVKVEDIDKALRQVEDMLRDQITNHKLPKDILKELEGGGFGISEGIQDPQRGEIA